MTFARTIPRSFANEKVLFVAREQFYSRFFILPLTVSCVRRYEFSSRELRDSDSLLLRDTSLQTTLLPVSRQERAVDALRAVSPKAVLPPALMNPGNTCLIEVECCICATW